MKFLIKIVSIVFMLSLPLLANSVATLTALKGNVAIKSENVSINATLGAKLSEKDHVVTQDKSKAQIIFNDETIVTVGKNSDFSIEKYIFDDTKEPTVEFSMIKGAMRAITGRIGKIAPQKFKVKTKTATIGIRGTNFTVIALEDGSMRAYCIYGAISVTVHKKTYIVHQGSYLVFGVDGSVNMKEFSADELKAMNTQRFGQRQALKDSQLNKGKEINTVSENFQTVFIQDISENMQDAIQTANQQSDTINMQGWSADTGPDIDTAVMAAKVSLMFAQDGSSFDTTNSWVEILNQANATTNLEFDDWRFTLKATPDSFTSKDNFTTSFDSVILSPKDASTSSNAQLVSSSFQATQDTVADDYMSWGTWNASVEYQYEDQYTGSAQPASHDFYGLWVAGEATSADVISARTQTAYYIGKYQAYQINASTPSVEAGDTSLYVDFGADQATLTINGNSNNGGSIASTYSYNNMTVGGNTIIGGTISAGSGTANGTFYGKNGESVGGNFSIRDNTNATEVKGVYQVTEELQ